MAGNLAWCNVPWSISQFENFKARQCSHFPILVGLGCCHSLNCLVHNNVQHFKFSSFVKYPAAIDIYDLIFFNQTMASRSCYICQLFFLIPRNVFTWNDNNPTVKYDQAGFKLSQQGSIWAWAQPMRDYVIVTSPSLAETIPLWALNKQGQWWSG